MKKMNKKRLKCRLGFHDYQKLDEGSVDLQHRIFCSHIGSEPAWAVVEECKHEGCSKRRAFVHSLVKGNIFMSPGRVLRAIEEMRYFGVVDSLIDDGVHSVYKSEIIAYLKIIKKSNKSPEAKKKWRDEYLAHCKKEKTHLFGEG